MKPANTKFTASHNIHKIWSHKSKHKLFIYALICVYMIYIELFIYALICVFKYNIYWRNICEIEVMNWRICFVGEGLTWFLNWKLLQELDWNCPGHYFDGACHHDLEWKYVKREPSHRNSMFCASMVLVRCIILEFRTNHFNQT